MEDRVKAEDNSESDDRRSYRRGRPRPISNRVRSTNPRRDSESELIDYNSIGMTHQAQLFLRRISKQVSGDIDLVESLNQVCKILCMNELEIVVWSIYLNDYNWCSPDLPLYEELCISGLAAKQYLNNDISSLKQSLGTSIANFDSKYVSWMKRNLDHRVDYKDINARYYELSYPVKNIEERNIDYNESVTQILESNHKKEERDEKPPEEEDMVLKRLKYSNEIDIPCVGIKEEYADFEDEESNLI
jgi:hypothetical protein